MKENLQVLVINQRPCSVQIHSRHHDAVRNQAIPAVELEMKGPGTNNANEVPCEYQGDNVLCSQLRHFGCLARRASRPLPCILQRLPQPSLRPAPPGQQRLTRRQATGSLLVNVRNQSHVFESHKAPVQVRCVEELVAIPMAWLVP
jgi:hypothetical protein